MARKPNYDFEKRRREAEKKAKKEAKREQRLLRKNRPDADAADATSDDGADATQDANHATPDANE